MAGYWGGKCGRGVAARLLLLLWTGFVREKKGEKCCRRRFGTGGDLQWSELHVAEMMARQQSSDTPASRNGRGGGEFLRRSSRRCTANVRRVRIQGVVVFPPTLVADGSAAVLCRCRCDPGVAGHYEVHSGARAAAPSAGGREQDATRPASAALVLNTLGQARVTTTWP
jgi:hypothetical protein